MVLDWYLFILGLKKNEPANRLSGKVAFVVSSCPCPCLFLRNVFPILLFSIVVKCFPCTYGMCSLRYGIADGPESRQLFRSEPWHLQILRHICRNRAILNNIAMQLINGSLRGLPISWILGFRAEFPIVPRLRPRSLRQGIPVGPNNRQL